MQRQFGEGNQGGWRMKRIGRRVMSSLLTVTMAVSLFHIPGAAGVVEAEEIPVRESNVTETTEDTIIVGVEGVECTSAQADILKIINDARWEACTAGNVPDPRNKKRMLTKDDYVEMKLGVKVQKTAVLRAAEGGVCLGHTRPDGSSCFTAGYSYAEKTMIYFVVNRFQIAKMKDIVHELDPNAYITITEVADVYPANQRK